MHTQHTQHTGTEHRLQISGRLFRFGAGPRPLAIDLPATALFVLFGIYCFAGLTGFDPSKQDEGYIFGIILEYLRGHAWTVPLLAGEPYMEKPPLYYLSGAFTAKLFAPWLPLHDGARIVSGIYTLLTAIATGLAARVAWGRGYGRFAVLALCGALGLLVPSHMMLTDNAELAGIALAVLGLVLTIRERRGAALALSCGVGVAFLAKGLFGPGLIGVGSVLLTLCFTEWRRPAVLRTFGIAALLALPWLLIWPIALWRDSPALFMQWFWINNLGRYAGFSVHLLYAVHQGGFWYKVLPWATFPLAPVLIVSAARWRRDAWRHCALQIAAVLGATLLAVLATASSVRAIYAMPLLPIMALAAAPAVRNPPHWLGNALIVLGTTLFGSIALSLFGLLALLDLGIKPPMAATWSTLLQPNLQALTHTQGIAACLAYALFWLAGIHLWRRRRWGGHAIWLASVTGVLVLVSQLVVPVVSADKSSFRPLFLSLAPYLPRHGCIESMGLGESQRGMLDYVLGVETLRQETHPGVRCPAVLVDGTIRDRMPQTLQGLNLVWAGMRAPDDHEKFWLYATPGEKVQTKKRPILLTGHDNGGNRSACRGTVGGIRRGQPCPAELHAAS